MRSHRRRLIAVVASLAIIGAACGDDSDDTTSATEPASTEAATPEATDAPDTTEATEGTEPATTEAPTTETTEFAAPERGDADLVIWADDTRTPVLTPIAEAFAAEEGIAVSVLEVPFDRIRDTLSTAGPAGQGPDIIIGAHDWLGELVSNGVVAPVDLGADAYLYS
jgi:arabinogalactan oligomer/maltooligosaccharide transport system substrate-binding protein